MELIYKVTENVTLDSFCNFIFYLNIVNIMTNRRPKGQERDVIIMANRINLNGTSYHGAGAIAEIANEAKAHAFKKAFVCSDPDLIKFNVTSKVTDILEKEGLEVPAIGCGGGAVRKDYVESMPMTVYGVEAYHTPKLADAILKNHKTWEDLRKEYSDIVGEFVPEYSN